MDNKTYTYTEEGEDEIDPTLLDFDEQPQEEKEEAQQAPTRAVKSITLEAMSDYMSKNKKKAFEIMEDLVEQGYTAINEENYLEMKEVLGDEVYKEIWANRTSMLPEHFDLINISNKSRAHTIAQLVVYADLMKGITQSNAQILEALADKLATRFEQSSTATVQSLEKNAEHLCKAILEDGTKILDQIKIEGTRVQNIMVQGENVQKDIREAEEKTMLRIESKITSCLDKNIEPIAIKMARKIGRDVFHAKFEDVKFKSKLYFGLMAGTFFVLGFAISKFFN
jgi:predicted CoA-binding protein